ncbi:MAG: hypothetical protein ACYDHW_14020 [Syntrophorhabdaceae bacterium]
MSEAGKRGIKAIHEGNTPYPQAVEGPANVEYIIGDRSENPRRAVIVVIGSLDTCGVLFYTKPIIIVGIQEEEHDGTF